MELNAVLTFIEDHAMTGLTNLRPIVWLTFIATSIISLASNWGLYDGELKMRIIIEKLMWFFFISFCISNWANLISMGLDTFKLAGVTAAGLTSVDANTYNPDGILDIGMTICGNLLSALSECNIFGKLFKGIVYVGACFMIIITSGQIALSWLMTCCGLVMVTVVGFFCLPWAMFDKTKFLFEKAITSLMAIFIKLMVLSFMLSLFTSYIKTIAQIQATADFAVILKHACGVAIFCYLVAKLPDSVASMFAGGQVFQAGSVAGAAVGVASAATSKPVMTGAAGAVKAMPELYKGGKNAIKYGEKVFDHFKGLNK